MFRIIQPATGAILGEYAAPTKAAALDAYARDAGYASFRAACDVTGDDPDDDAGLIVREYAPSPGIDRDAVDELAAADNPTAGLMAFILNCTHGKRQ